MNNDSNETASEFVRNKIRSIVRDPKVAELLLPKDHPIGTKRLCLDDGYFETFNRENVTLVDVRADPIVQITPSGLRTRMREFGLDDIAFATGFQSLSQFNRTFKKFAGKSPTAYRAAARATEKRRRPR